MRCFIKIFGLIIFAVAITPLCWAGLPDLAISDVKVNSQCKLDISVKNYGDSWPAQNYTFYIGIQAVKDNKGAGGWSQPISQAQELGPAGGELTFHFFPLTISGPTEIRLDVDKYRRIVESNENNNYTVRTVTCGTTTPSPTSTSTPQATTNITPSKKEALDPRLIKRRRIRRYPR